MIRSVGGPSERRCGSHGCGGPATLEVTASASVSSTVPTRTAFVEGTPSDERDDEAKLARARLAEIRVKIDTLLDSLTPTNKEFVDEKLTSLKAEKDRLEGRLLNLEIARPRVNVKAVVDAGIAQLRRFGELLAHGSIEEQKSIVQAFLARIDLSPREGRSEAYFVRLLANCSFEVVAGARYEPVQMKLEPPDRFVVRGRGLRSVA